MSSVRLPQEQADCTTQPTNEQPCSQNSIFPDMTGSRFECLAGILQGEPLWHGKAIAEPSSVVQTHHPVT